MLAYRQFRTGDFMLRTFVFSFSTLVAGARLLLPSRVAAQTTTGSMVGTVNDPNGAVPGFHSNQPGGAAVNGGSTRMRFATRRPVYGVTLVAISTVCRE
jgi:hypothetical protein